MGHLKFEKWPYFFFVISLKGGHKEESPCVSSHMSLQNSTASSALYELYSGTDFLSLNWFELQWAAWYIWVGNPVIATALMAFTVHEVSFRIWTRRFQPTYPCFFNSLFISGVVFHGLSSIQFHTSDGGSCNLTRYLRRKNNGLALCRSCSLISLLNSRWYVDVVAKFGRNS